MNKDKTERVKEPRDVGDLILHKKVVKLITALLQENKWTLSKLKRETGLSFPYVMRKIGEFEELGILISTKEKKARTIALTEKGVRLASKLNEVFAVLYEDKTETPAKKNEAELKETRPSEKP